jgi:prepilin-type N-terminal cleavage/methylation domain-containing protein
MMTTTFRHRAAKGFTLIELLIVVIIIAILAAIAIPQFSNTSSDAQESSAMANLATIRSAIELYRVQHNNIYPAVNDSKDGGTCSLNGTAGTGGSATKSTEAAFKEQLTMYSDANGHTCSVAAPTYIYGPYLRAIPTEPITNSAVVTVAATDGDSASDGSSVGWRFVTANGKVMIHSNKKARDGTTLLNAK